MKADFMKIGGILIVSLRGASSRTPSQSRSVMSLSFFFFCILHDSSNNITSSFLSSNRSNYRGRFDVDSKPSASASQFNLAQGKAGYMAMKKQRISKEDRAFSRGVTRTNFAGDDAGAPKGRPPLDPIPEYEPKKYSFEGRFEAVVDPALQLTEEAVKRIEKLLRQAVLMEIAQLDFLPEVVVTAVRRSRSRGIEVRLVRE
jgi:hypothetical protein